MADIDRAAVVRAAYRKALSAVEQLEHAVSEACRAMGESDGQVKRLAWLARGAVHAMARAVSPDVTRYADE